MASEDRSTMFRTGMQGKLIVRNLIREILSFHIEFSTGDALINK
jgi:hypothetical protein